MILLSSVVVIIKIVTVQIIIIAVVIWQKSFIKISCLLKQKWWGFDI